jgi:hypothetical protein
MLAGATRISPPLLASPPPADAGVTAHRGAHSAVGSRNQWEDAGVNKLSVDCCANAWRNEGSEGAVDTLRLGRLVAGTNYQEKGLLRAGVNTVVGLEKTTEQDSLEEPKGPVQPLDHTGKRKTTREGGAAGGVQIDRHVGGCSRPNQGACEGGGAAFGASHERPRAQDLAAGRAAAAQLWRGEKEMDDGRWAFLLAGCRNAPGTECQKPDSLGGGVKAGGRGALGRGGPRRSPARAQAWLAAQPAWPAHDSAAGSGA